MPATRRLVLASTSRYRRELLLRLGLPFECCDPGVDESLLEGEPPARAAERLAAAKARAVAGRYPDALIIGSDQVAYCGDLRLDKPLTHENAVRQLFSMSGRRATFETAVALLDAAADALRARVVPTVVQFRPLSQAMIETYLRREQPYDCAGSAKAEGLGIALIAHIDSPDPTAMLGLPLIALTDLLTSAGLPVLPP